MASLSRRERVPSNAQEEMAKVKELRDKLGPLDKRAAIFCTDDCLHRFLRARNWSIRKAEKMLKDTLKWRAQYKPEEITWEDVAHEAETGKLYRTNFLDKQGDSVLVMAPGRQNTNNHDSQIKHLVYCLENAIICLPPGREHMVWLIDFRGWTLRMSPPLKTSRETLNILQSHYPERLGTAVLYNSPPVFETFWKMIRPFIDPKTAKKVKFLNSKSSASKKLLEELFDLDTLEKAFGGRSTWVYNNEEYGRLMMEDDVKTAMHWGLPIPDNLITANGPTKSGRFVPEPMSISSISFTPPTDTAHVAGEEFYDGSGLEKDIANLALEDDNVSSSEEGSMPSTPSTPQGRKAELI